MAEKLISEVIKETPIGIEVMGIDSSGFPFYGKTTGHMQVNDSGIVTTMEIKGYYISKNDIVRFDRDLMPFSKLRHFDRVAFDKLILLESEKSNCTKHVEINANRAKAASEKMRQIMDC